MKPYRRRGRWVIPVLATLMVVLLGAQATLPVSEGWHQVMELGVLGTIGAVLWWWNRHTAAAQEKDRVLQEIEQRAADRRDVPLTDIQARYLLAHARHTHARHTQEH